MKPLSNLIILIFVTAALACTIKKKDKREYGFLVSVKSQRGDTTITSAVYYGGHILCLQEDGKIVVLDTTFNYVDSLTIKFANLKIQFLRPYNDTIVISTDKEVFYLSTDFTLKKYNGQTFKYGLHYYSDSTYYVYACSAGEWGGSVFFWDRKKGKTYSYPATGVQQVLKFKDSYIVSSYLAHLSGLSDYLSIKDPTKLYELNDEKQKTFCNWYMQVDSIKDTKLFDTMTPPGVKYYADNFTTRTITTFPYQDTLYSIYCTDSATILAKHVNFKLIQVDTLLKREIYFSSAATHLTQNRSVTSYRGNWGVLESKDKVTYYQNTGLLFIDNNKITFIEFKTPHMWTENNSR